MAVLLALGCTSDPGGGAVSCQDQEPAFVLSVRTAENRALPAGTQLVVRYGGGLTEEYRVGSDAGAPGPMVFCAETGPDGGAATGLQCELYTGQAAEVTVEAAGYPATTQVLTLDRNDNDCVVTREVELVLVSSDAGG